MNVLLIGGTRFIGLHTVRELARRGHQVTVFHRGKSPAELPNGVNEMLGDMTELSKYRTDIEALAPDIVIHNILIQESNAAELMAAIKGISRRVIGISSGDVYLAYGRVTGSEPGDIVPMPLHEDSPLRIKLYPYRQAFNPDDPRYNYDKIPIERILLRDDNLPGTILRLPFVYGPLDYQRRLYDFLKPMNDGRPALIMDEALANWRITMGYVEDVARAIASAAEDDRAAGRIYNVGEPDGISMLELAKAVAAEVNWQGQIHVMPSEKLPVELQHDVKGQDMVMNTGRIRRELDFSEKYSREAAIRRTIVWDRANPPDDYPLHYELEDEILSRMA